MVSARGTGTGKTTMELQSPTMAIGIYSSWSTDVWDFGTTTQYPALQVQQWHGDAKTSLESDRKCQK